MTETLFWCFLIAYVLCLFLRGSRMPEDAARDEEEHLRNWHAADMVKRYNRGG